MLELKIARNSPFEKEAILVKEALASQCESIALNSHFVLHVNEEIYLSLENSEISEKDFKIDVFNEKLLWRLNHSGKNSEAVCRAVIGKLSKPVVFDATAGLGRESLILQSAGARVYMFERNPVIWLLLVSAMKKAQVSPDILSKLKNGLPTLCNFGSVKDNLTNGVQLETPDVVYYDPMFPERAKSALVKKDMRVFHELVGFDLDTVDYANYFLSVATHHLVVKRPSNEPPLELNVRRSSFVDGKACRFDCYYCQH